MVDNLSVDPKRKGDDKLWKIRPRLENLWHKLRKMYPEEINSVNEIMVPYMGKSYLCQYLPNKPHKWRFKIWGRIGVSGFRYDFDVYQGRSNKNNSTFDVSGDVVANLCSTLPKQKTIKCLLTTFLPVYHSLSTSNQTVFGIVKLFVHQD